MANIERVCLNAIIRNLSPNYWYDGYDILAKHTDDLISTAQIVMVDRSVFEEFPIYLNKMVKMKNLEKKSAEVLESRFGLFTFNYEPELMNVYYNAFFYASALADSPKREITNMDEMIDLLSEVPDVILSEEQKNQIMKYQKSIKGAALIEEEHLETLRKYYAMNPKVEKTLITELEKEKAYSQLNSMVLKEESLDLITQYILRELRNGSTKYRKSIYERTPEELNNNPEKT